MPEELFRMSTGVLLCWLAQIGAAIVGFIGMVVIRWRRRGAARLDAIPAFAAIVLFQIVLTSGVASLGVRKALAGSAGTGAGAIATESEGIFLSTTVPMLGLSCAAALAVAAVVAVAFGSSKSGANGPSRGLANVGMSAAAAALTAGLAIFVWKLATDALGGPSDALARLDLVAVASSGVLMFLLLTLVVVSLRRTPREKPELAVQGMAIALLATIAAGSLGGIAVVRHRVQCFGQLAMTGEVCPDLQAMARRLPSKPPVEGDDEAERTPDSTASSTPPASR